MKARHLELAKGWIEAATSNKVAIYEYYINRSWTGLPRIIVDLIGENLKALYKMGIDLFT